MSETENPDGPRNEEPEVTPESTPAPVEETPAEPAPAAEAPAADEPVAETPAAPDERVAETAAPDEPVAETPAAPGPADDAPAPPEQPVTPEPAAAEPVPGPATPAEPTPAPTATPAATTPAADATSGGDDGEEIAARVRPEIPGADLVPDIVSEGEEYLDAEARAAAEADAEARAAASAQDEDSDHAAQPIADAAINLATGARYTATGKRKTAVARVILKPGTGTYLINGKQLDDFFPRPTLQRIIRQPLEAVGYEARMDVVARMHGGGVAAQAGALRHGISRALLEADPNLRGELKRRGFLTRDPRVKERKKAGLKKARKRPQFSKR